MEISKSDFEDICRFCLRANPHPTPIFTQMVEDIVIKEETGDLPNFVPKFISVLTNLNVCIIL